jgi:hypothetical protein
VQGGGKGNNPGASLRRGRAWRSAAAGEERLVGGVGFAEVGGQCVPCPAIASYAGLPVVPIKPRIFPERCLCLNLCGAPVWWGGWVLRYRVMLDKST